MTTRAAEGILRSDPIHTSADYEDNGSSLATTTATNGWAEWVERRIEARADAVTEGIGEAVGEITAKLEKRVKDLELQLATAMGALDVLRGKGMPGSFNFRGVFGTKASYNHMDVVVCESSSFVALKDNPGPCPGTGWQMIACGGRRGDRGERGPTGPAAAPLKWIGSSLNFRNGGVALELRMSDGGKTELPLFANITVDASDFTLRFIGADNSSVLKVSLAPLFKKFQEETRA